MRTREQRIIRFRTKIESVVLFCSFLVAWLLTFPAPLWVVTSGLDPSWILALHLAVAKGFVFGENVLFSYGPLGYLFFPLYINYSLWTSSVIFRNIVHTGFYATLAVFALRSNNRLFNGLVLAFSGVLIEIYLSPATYVLPALILLLLILSIDCERYWYVVPLSAIAAITFYMKTDIGLITLATVLLAIFWVALKHQLRIASVAFAAYVIAFLCVGYQLMHSNEAFSLFLIGSSQLALGFGPAMSIDGPLWELVVGLVAIAGLVLYALCQLRSKKLAPVLVSLGFLFITFKEGFVRHDVHVLAFFGGWALFFALSLTTRRGFNYKNVLLRTESRALKSFLMVIMLMLLLSGSISGAISLRTVYSPYSPNLSYPPLTIYQLANPKIAEDEFSRSVEMLRLHYNLSNETLAMISNHTVDVFQRDVAVAYVYDLQWDPRPIFQSYSAYTSYLDELNAHHLNSSSAPDYVLYAFGTIDNRYPLFDEPATFRDLLCNYLLKAVDNLGPEPVYILRKAPNRCGGQVTISRFEVNFNESVAIPFRPGYVFADVIIEHNGWGELRDIIYKNPPVYIKLDFSDGSSQTYRFVPELGKDGIFLSATPNYRLFDNRIAPFLINMSFLTPNENYYKSKIGIEFFMVPVESLRSLENGPIGNLTDKNFLPGGLGFVDSINGQITTGDSIYVNRSAGKIEVQGWAASPLRGESEADQVFVSLDGNPRGSAIYGFLRPDVAKALGNYSYIFSGWKWQLPLSEIADGCHRLEVAASIGSHYYLLSSISGSHDLHVCIVSGNSPGNIQSSVVSSLGRVLSNTTNKLGTATLDGMTLGNLVLNETCIKRSAVEPTV